MPWPTVSAEQLGTAVIRRARGAWLRVFILAAWNCSALAPYPLARALSHVHFGYLLTLPFALRLLRTVSLVAFAFWFGLLWPIRIGANMSERASHSANAIGCHNAPAVIDKTAIDDSLPAVPPCHRSASAASAQTAPAPASVTETAQATDHGADCRCASGASIGRRPCGCGHSLGAIPPPPDPMLAWLGTQPSQRLVAALVDSSIAKTAALPILPPTPPPNV
jgi:hypothetical protein